MEYSKIGFHTGPGGNHNGIGKFMADLDAAGIPFCIKGTDHAGVVFEGQLLAAKSGVPHVLIYRKSGIGTYDTPNYDLLARDAAAVHWEKHIAVWPPELDRARVWIETVNEIDKGRAPWVGRFNVHTARLALEAGRRWAGPGWSSGEPEVNHWEIPEMLAFLSLVGDNPERLAVALHEYSYKSDDLLFEMPWKIGRFQQMYGVCDKYKIERPTVLITELGWSYDAVPHPDLAIEQIALVAELYARHKGLKGAALWNLGVSQVSNETQRLIEPLLEYTLGARFPDPEPPPPEPEPEAQLVTMHTVRVYDDGTSEVERVDFNPLGEGLLLPAHPDDWRDVQPVSRPVD